MAGLGHKRGRGRWAARCDASKPPIPGGLPVSPSPLFFLLRHHGERHETIQHHHPSLSYTPTHVREQLNNPPPFPDPSSLPTTPFSSRSTFSTKLNKRQS